MLAGRWRASQVCRILFFLSLVVYLTYGCSTTLAQPSETAVPKDPMVAKIDLTLKLKDQQIDSIQKGDLLTVVVERETDIVILTPNGKKGAVSKQHLAKLTDALPVYDELILRAPQEGRLYTLRASTHWALGNTERALEDFDRAIELGYTVAHAYNSRGLFNAAVGQNQRAIADFTSAIEADSKNEIAFINRASVYMAVGQYQQAIDDYTQAINLRPNNPILYSQRAVAHKLAGQLQQALENYDQSIRLVDKDVSAWMGRGFIKFQLARHQAAVDDFSQAIKLAPQSAAAYNNRGYNYQLLKQYSQAAQDYQRATELAPQYLLALQNRAWLLATCEEESLQDAPLAIEIARQVNEITEYKEVNDLTLLAAAFASAGEFETAIGWQEKAIAACSEQQKPVAEKILSCYQNKQPLDLSLLEKPSK